MPFFRWVATLGLVLIGCSVGLYAASSDPDIRQIDLTVIHEAPSGACTVRWTDPFDGHQHQGPYTCHADRVQILKGSSYDPVTGHGWDTGWIVASGSHKGDLYSLDQSADGRLTTADKLLLAGLLATIVGAVGGNIRALARMTGVNPAIVGRARRLRDAAALVAEDHRRALEAVRDAWTPQVALTDPELLAALRVLVEAGVHGRKVATTGADLANRLDALLTDAAPAAGRRQMLAAGREDRLRALAAVSELRWALAEAECRNLAEQFAQTSVDLLRGPDNAPSALTATVDYESRPADYARALTEVVGVVPSPAVTPAVSS
ncbi:hypothetical protein [Streptomyces sp. NPDC049040]|uniref:hypothetical protein n=1 Tax=Streptomyces sp. NPDC049040 TaxID=3365593 RepID=UPI003713FB58